MTSSSPSTGDLILDNASVLLNALRKISSATSIPFLSEAASIAFKLVSLVQDVRDNNDAFKALGFDAGTLVRTIATECERMYQTGGSIPAYVHGHLEELLKNLRFIQQFIEAKISRAKLKQYISFMSDKQDAVRYREILRSTLDAFNLQSSMAAQQGLQSISQALHQQRADLLIDRINAAENLQRMNQQRQDDLNAILARQNSVRLREEKDRLDHLGEEQGRLREEHDYHARVQHQQQVSQHAEEERLRAEAEEARKAKVLKIAAAMLARDDAEKQQKLEAKKRRAEVAKEREENELAAALEAIRLQERREAQKEREDEEDRRNAAEERRRQRRHDRERQEEEELRAKKIKSAARKRAVQQEEDAREEARRRRRKAEKKRREGVPRDSPQRGHQENISASSTNVNITVSKTTKKKEAPEIAQGDDSDLDEFDDPLWDSEDDQEYWSDEGPLRSKVKRFAAMGGRPRSYNDVDELRASASIRYGSHAKSFFPPLYGSPYLAPHPVMYDPAYHPSRSNGALSTRVSEGSGNVSVVTISNSFNRY